MNISELFKSVQKDLTMEDLTQLTYENFDLFLSKVYEKLNSYDELTCILKKYDLDINNIYFNLDHMYSLWYIDSPAYINLNHLINMDYTFKSIKSYKKFIQSHFDNNDWLGGFVVLNDVFRVEYFLNHYQEIDKDQIQEVLNYLYVDREYVLEKLPIELIKSIFKGYGVEKLNNYDNEIIIYRGQTDNSTNLKNALSWTLNFDTAKFFATRFQSKGIIYKASIKKEDIIMYTNDREEYEILTDFKNIKNLKVIREY